MPLDKIGGAALPPRIVGSEGAGLPIPGQQESGGQSFGELLQGALGEVNSLQSRSGEMVQRFAQGEQIDVHRVMIAMEQAGTAMALTVQVRNKLLEAYQEVLRTQV